MPTRAIVIDPKDNVAVALANLETGETVEVPLDGATLKVTLRQPVAFGHKLALRPIPTGEPVVKYGEVIGQATRPIEPGDLVHTHNLESQRGRKN